MTKQRIISALILMGQILVISGLVYSTWNLGGVTTRALQHVAVGSLLTLIIAAITLFLRADRSQRSLCLPAIGCLFLGYALLQGVVLQGPVLQDSIGASNLTQQFAEPTVSAIDDAIAELKPSQKSAEPSTISAILNHRTQAAMVPLACGIAFLISASVFFDDRRSRVVFAFALLANSMALVCWGFIQRAGNNEFILPGMTHEVDSVPFASFIYKNAGAAALVPAIAIAVVALLKGRTLTWSSPANGSTKSQSAYGSASRFFELSNLILISTATFLGAGLAISLCRGAWAATLIALMVALVADRRLKLTRSTLSAAALGAAVVVTLLFILGGDEIARARAGDVSIDRVASDQRWSHWPDGWDTAVAHFPTGSGLGSYRYATLPYQRTIHKSWFQNAHNQYLETFTETGLLGTALLVLAIVWIAHHCLGLIRDGEDSSSRRWGLIALVVLVSGCIQSLIDFVLIIPANTYLYAAVFGVASSCRRQSLNSVTNRFKYLDWNLGWKTSTATVCTCSLFLMASINFCSSQRFVEQVLAQTQTSKLEGKPSASQIDHAIAQLDQALNRQPSSSKVHSRRADWKLIQMRIAIMELARESGEPLIWETTDLRRLFVAMHSTSPEQRSELAQNLRSSPVIREYLAAALIDLKTAACLQPCIPHSHLTAAFLSPIAKMPVQTFLPKVSKLSNNSHHLLYNCGLIACMVGDSELAVDSWHRCLNIRLSHLNPIYKLSSQHFSADVVAARIIPKRRMDLTVRMVSDFSATNPWTREKVASEITTAIQGRDDLDPAVRWSWIAKIHECVQQHDLASIAWRKAVATGGRNLNYRYALAVSLNRIGKTEEAIDQALLGSAIASGDDRFDRLVKRYRHELAKQSQQRFPLSHAATLPGDHYPHTTKVSL